jgi:acyl carrier protein
MSAESIEESLRAEWCELLEVEGASDDDEFFNLGGNSMLAVALVERVEKRTGIEFPLDVLFLDGTFGALLSACRSLDATADR